MKTLIIVRHAKSSWGAPTLKDHDRALNERGLRDAPFMGSVLAKRGVKPSRILSSSATRAHETAKYFALALGFPVEEIDVRPELYNADAWEILNIVTKLDDADDLVLLFGHNPTLTQVVNSFTEQYLDNVPTCGTNAIGFEVEHWFDASAKNGRLLYQEFPKVYFPQEVLD